jgi:DNA repair exonuclease SbcCD ATPase subunit
MNIFESKLSKYIYKIKNSLDINKLPVYYDHFNYYVKSLDRIMNGGANYDDIEEALNELNYKIKSINQVYSFNFTNNKKIEDIDKKVANTKNNIELLGTKLNESILELEKEKAKELESAKLLKEKEENISKLTKEKEEQEKELKENISKLTKEKEEQELKLKENISKLTKEKEEEQTKNNLLNVDKTKSVDLLSTLEDKIKDVLSKFLSPEQIRKVWK